MFLFQELMATPNLKHKIHNSSEGKTREKLESEFEEQSNC